MPWKPSQHCSTSGCGEIVASGKCAKHRREIDAARRARETWRDYNSPEWKANRSYVLRVEPNCRFCQAPAEVVDHITPLQSGGTHAMENLRPLCKSCHDRRTYEDTIARHRLKKRENEDEQG